MGHHHTAPPAGQQQAQRLRAVLAWFEGQPAAAICRQDQLCRSALSTCCQYALTVLSRATEDAITLGWKYHEDDAMCAITGSNLWVCSASGETITLMLFTMSGALNALDPDSISPFSAAHISSVRTLRAPQD